MELFNSLVPHGGATDAPRHHASASGLFFLGLLGAAGTLMGCAAEPHRSTPAGEKIEALEGAACIDDGECDHGEFCDLVLCIPERECPPRGECRMQTFFYDDTERDIPDNNPAGVTGEILIDRPDAAVRRILVTADINHTYQGDLRVVLRSPSGTELVLHDREGGSADDLFISETPAAFEGENVAGLWTLQVSDTAARDTGRLMNWRIEISVTSLTPDPEPAVDVWASVPVSFASAHPYLNDTDLVVGLGSETGGASRARIHFTRLDTEAGYDFVDVIDANTGEVLDHFTGHLGELTTREYDTGNLDVRLVSDYSVTDWGFDIDRVDVFGAGCLEDADCGEGYACPVTRVCVRAPCFQECTADVPTDPGGEGDACATGADCAEELYCNSENVCAADGSCGSVGDCSAADNSWFHLACLGTTTCESGLCGWSCGTTPSFCIEGETRIEACNTCTCTSGVWACTERACQPTSGIGGVCNGRVICESGLHCERGPSTNGACGNGRDGVCRLPGASASCPPGGEPVCTCTGQTFPSECARQGSGADWASAGACEFSSAIPDADAEGITETVHVIAPFNGRAVRVTVDIEHSYRGDLVVWLQAPDGSRHTLTDRAGNSADDFHYDDVIDLAPHFVRGGWTLHVSDHASRDVGVLRFFNVVGEAVAPSLGTVCATRGAPSRCDYGEYCHKEAGTFCGFADHGGICRRLPETCAPDASPVCGCNNEQYINACMANADGVSVRVAEPCPF